VIPAALIVVAIAAAVRSTWSPCGLSMLSTITPLGERGRGGRFGVTAAWFVVGSVIGGLTLGAAGAGLAAAVASWHLSASMAAAAAAVAATITAASDAAPARWQLPIHRRQVNEVWLDRYRPWVYGLGFGWQIGAGLTTYIMTAAVYLTVVLAALSGDPLLALGAGAAFGLVRGLAVYAGRDLATPEALRRFHRRFTAVGPTVGLALVGVQAMVAAALGGRGLGWPAAAALGLAPIVVVLGKMGSRRGQESLVVAGPAYQAHPDRQAVHVR
jgi:MFS family permease